ncbi:threonine synthase [Rhodonellum psychrophilum GCM71 = DSM 17998]|uniref:Threonine synthase n=2 Tax=Rhodonellum TaxID=336827 RepID=U5BY14_9BACT|nr:MULTISPECIES: threonine synthase [Rhodonellum]ERM80797.1 threonine synthase [Rhodonellum psychrophilum GCM71 = DSM 17998]MDO9553584.1 threonine synthase [Rhodonellum sp.]SDZ44988.1 threonine synthase [Rhodonellum ikkaensis]
MNFYSTNNPKHIVSLKEAVIQGLAPDQGLYMPGMIPVMPQSFFDRFAEMSFQEMGEEIISALFGEDLDPSQIKALVEHTLAFDAPLVKVEEGIYSLELFHGPTLAFKDFGARFCSKLMSMLMVGEERKIRVLVATSGDTGSAVANGFYKVPGVEVVILYPKGKVSELQEKQFTTLGENITALEVEGVFDDCQQLVKDAFLDEELNQKMLLTSANSINIARWIPQCLYYFYAISRFPEKNKKVAISVPSGNFGNLGAGILAQKMGLPIDVFIASTNVNKIVPDFLHGNSFSSKKSVPTISNSMDVGNPSNFSRLLALYDNDEGMLREKVRGFYFDDLDTQKAMRAIMNSTGYILDPHGAVGYLGLRNFRKQNPEYVGIFLETAHPGKFKEVVEETLGIKLELPERLEKFLHGTKKVESLANDFGDFKAYLLASN